MNYMSAPKVLGVGLSLVVAGCSVALPRVSYDQAVTNRTNNSATVGVVTRVGTGKVPMVPGGPPLTFTRVQFNPEDQGIFAECLGEELTRLGLLQVLPAGASATTPDVTILLTFTKADLRSAFYEHTLGLTMTISSGGRAFERTYEVDSHEGETAGKKWNTSGKEGKAMAAKKLLAKVIPDIDAFLGQGT